MSSYISYTNIMVYHISITYYVILYCGGRGGRAPTNWGRLGRTPHGCQSIV